MGWLWMVRAIVLMDKHDLLVQVALRQSQKEQRLS